eukprot:Protomagalhaensia_sp_Gyna_25__3536@NODE_317_length_3909_cov_32_619380_g247_i0_p1_GENE_NODE_317_length_3909_cov_32_619380_g247_i0NODE_317_length_3909_cov_32_619380_g247_i0_p1_ORF_typecomplete_len620_score87_44KH_1/PF00013_29/58KH_1/PF00013_29/4_2e06KH_2/PF07650_17/0_0075KH_4/PF13083_6/0_083KH_4/PF13083_6/6_2e03KAR9/PF08580_10/0_39_NODE_317_length_3909_cov_32_619380_g247_i0881947
MELFLPPVEVVLPAAVDLSLIPPKCDCKIRAYLEFIRHKSGIPIHTDSNIEDVDFGLYIPGAWPEKIRLPGWQVLIPPHRIQAGKTTAKQTQQSLEGEESRNKVLDVYDPQSTGGFSLGDCAEATVPAREVLYVPTDWEAELVLLGELVEVIDESTFRFRHSHTGDLHIVEKDKLRPVHTASQSVLDWCNNGSFITMAKVAVLNELSDWASNPSMSGDFLCNILWERTGVVFASVHEYPPEKGDASSGAFAIHVYGSTEAVEQARILVSQHMKTVWEAVAFQERRSRRLKLLEDRRGGLDNYERVELIVHESLVGLVIGKQGENLARVARNHKVEVRVFPDENGVRRLRIYGSDIAKVDRAKADLDYHFLEIPLPHPHAERFIEWITADKAFLRDCCNRHALHSLWFNPARSSLVVCGLRRSIDDFLRTMDAAHRETSPAAALKASQRTSPSTALSSARAGSSAGRSPPLSPPGSSSVARPPILDALHNKGRPLRDSPKAEKGDSVVGMEAKKRSPLLHKPAAPPASATAAAATAAACLGWWPNHYRHAAVMVPPPQHSDFCACGGRVSPLVYPATATPNGEPPNFSAPLQSPPQQIFYEMPPHKRNHPPPMASGYFWI